MTKGSKSKCFKKKIFLEKVCRFWLSTSLPMPKACLKPLIWIFRAVCPSEICCSLGFPLTKGSKSNNVVLFGLTAFYQKSKRQYVQRLRIKWTYCLDKKSEKAVSPKVLVLFGHTAFYRKIIIHSTGLTAFWDGGKQKSHCNAIAS